MRLRSRSLPTEITTLLRSPSSAAQEAREALGTRLREIRTEAGLTGRVLAQVAGWHFSKVSKIEHGRQPPSVLDIRAWCKHCGNWSRLGDRCSRSELWVTRGSESGGRDARRRGRGPRAGVTAPLRSIRCDIRIYPGGVLACHAPSRCAATCGDSGAPATSCRYTTSSTTP